MNALHSTQSKLVRTFMMTATLFSSTLIAQVHAQQAGDDPTSTSKQALGQISAQQEAESQAPCSQCRDRFSSHKDSPNKQKQLNPLQRHRAIQVEVQRHQQELRKLRDATLAEHRRHQATLQQLNGGVWQGPFFGPAFRGPSKPPAHSPFTPFRQDFQQATRSSSDHHWSLVGDDFSFSQSLRGLTVSLQGTLSNGQLVLTVIKIDDGQESRRYPSLEDVPSDHQDEVNDVLAQAGQRAR